MEIPEIKIMGNALRCAAAMEFAAVIDSWTAFPIEKMFRGEYGEALFEKGFRSIIHHGKYSVSFPTGFLPRIVQAAEKDGYKVTLDSPLPFIEPEKPYLKPTTFPDGRTFEDFRPDQLKMIEGALKKGRGVLQGFTGVGKTIIAMGMMTAYKKVNILYLVHTKDLVAQISKDLKAFGIVHHCYYGEERSLGPGIIVGTRQSIIKLDLLKWKNFFQVIMVDEVHHVSTLDGQYSHILRTLQAPARFGFTATPNKKPEAAAAAEGFIGPVIETMTIQDGTQLGLLAEPKICIRKIPFSRDIKNLKRYADQYRYGVVERVDANELRVLDAMACIEVGLTTLIVVTNIDHGKNIQKIMREKLKQPVLFLYGRMEMEVRNQVKELFKSGEVLCVIVNVIWKEGVNIPKLDVVLNAAMGKSEITTLQSLGRGLRKTDSKEDVLYIDYFDPSSTHFISHFGERLTLFMNEGWQFQSLNEFLKRREDGKRKQGNREQSTFSAIP
jgi:superfamily II DNA or RNA helicase